MTDLTERPLVLHAPNSKPSNLVFQLQSEAHRDPEEKEALFQVSQHCDIRVYKL